jgi:hypothetical protein
MLGVGVSVGEKVPDDDQDGVGDRDGGLLAAGLAEVAVQAPVAGAEPGSGMRGGPGGFDRHGGQVRIAGPGLAAARSRPTSVTHKLPSGWDENAITDTERGVGPDIRMRTRPGGLTLLLSSAVAWSAGLYLLCTARAQAAVNQVRQEMSQLIGDSWPGDDVPLG